MKLQLGNPKEGDYSHKFFCPGCNHKHGFWTEGKTKWQFNGDMEKPTVSPSILYTVDLPPEHGGKKVCHSFIKDGKIQFLSDCTHSLAGKTVELPEIEM